MLFLASSCPQIDGDKMTLYGMRYCPYTHRVHLILNAKEVSYNTVNINLRDKPEWFQQKSSSGKVPALEIPKKNITIHDSMIISEYLNDTYVDPQLHRPDPLDRSLDRLLIDKFNAVISPLYKVLTSKSGLTGVEEHLQNFMNNLDVFENELGTRETKFFTGNRPGMVDYMIWPWIESSEMIYYIDNSNFELDIFRFPKVVSCSRFFSVIIQIVILDHLFAERLDYSNEK